MLSIKCCRHGTTCQRECQCTYLTTSYNITSFNVVGIRPIIQCYAKMISLGKRKRSLNDIEDDHCDSECYDDESVEQSDRAKEEYTYLLEMRRRIGRMNARLRSLEAEVERAASIIPTNIC